MDAVNQLIRDGLIATNQEIEKSQSSKTVRSMPSIFERAKKSLLDEKSSVNSSKIYKLPAIFENAQDKVSGLKTLEKLDLPRYKKNQNHC